MRNTGVYDLQSPFGERLAWIQSRPTYCDRGRFHANVDAVPWKSEADPWPRYYFDLDRAKAEVVAYLEAKRVDVTGANWIPWQDEPELEATQQASKVDE